MSKAFLEDHDKSAELTLPSPSLLVLCLVQTPTASRRQYHMLVG